MTSDAASAPAPEAWSLPSVDLLRRLPAGALAEELRSAWGGEAAPEGDWLCPEALAVLYRHRGYEPLFLRSEASLARSANLLRALAGVDSMGLDPRRYRPDALRRALAAVPHTSGSWWNRLKGDGAETRESLARLDGMLCDRYLALAWDFYYGESDSLPALLTRSDVLAAADSVIRATPPDTVLTLLSGEVLPPVGAWAPTHPQYRLLARWLPAFRRLVDSGGWARVDPGPTIKPGERSHRVAQLRARLDAEDRALTGATPPPAAVPTLFDRALVERVEAFQRRHALDDDGAVGKSSVVELNVSAADRLKQIEVTLARWRRAAHGEPPFRVEVNVPRMKVYLYEAGTPVLGLKTVVGSGKESARWLNKTSWAQTPELIDEIETIEVNPRWYIPEIIVRTELLAREKKKPGFLDKEGYEWYDPRTGQHGPASSIPEADWGDPDKRLHLRQKSGPKNSLGRIKFVFRNRYAVYLHDTPEKHLFTKGRRNFSHGCVRVENPTILADSLLAHSRRQPPKPLATLMADTTRVVIPLKPPVPIHLIYRTAWVDADSALDLLPDLYGWDRDLEAALPPPESAGPLRHARRGAKSGRVVSAASAGGHFR